MPERKTFRGTRRKEPFLTIEEKVEQFVLRNSRNGFFTRVSTIHSKFDVSQERTWEIVGTLLTGGTLESTHDPITGEMKLCEIDKTYSIMGTRRKGQKHSKRGPKKPVFKRGQGGAQ